MDEWVELVLKGGRFRKLQDEHFMGLRRKYDMKKAEMEILYFLSKCGENNTSTDIYHKLAMNRGHISQAVDSLCKRNYLTAIPDQEDRRYVHYKLTDAAQEIVQELKKEHEEISKKILDGVTEEELNTLKRIAYKMWKNMDKLLQ